MLSKLLHWVQRLTARRPAARRAVVEELEPRILYSADANPLLWGALEGNATALVGAVDAGQDTNTPQAVDAPQQQQRRHEIVFVDAAVPDAQKLIDGLLAQRSDSADIEVVQLRADADGLQQVSDVLAGERNIDAVHIVSHGEAGRLWLGNGIVGADQLRAHGGFDAWKAALGADADVLLWGCNVAEGAAGEAFVRQFAVSTGADVAASSDDTGSAARSGNWTLEFASGGVLPSNTLAGAGWDGVLAIYTVTNTNDSGAGSLRQAILNANANGGADVITFNINGGGAERIRPTSALPTIIDTVTIDGRSQPGFAGTPLIELRGDNAGAGVDGLTFSGTSDGSIVRGLIIFDYTRDGIVIQAGADNITVAGNWIGTTGTGTTGDGNGDDGIEIAGSFAIIGGTGANDRNVITNNADEGINIVGSGITGHVIQGNYIGVDPDGATGGGNVDVGIAIMSGSGNTIGGTSAAARNVISRNWEGLEVNTANNTIQGNYIGTDAGGTQNRGNRLGDGIQIQNGANGTLVGGSVAGAGNVIAGNALAGVAVIGGGGANATIQGNTIGLNAVGGAALANSIGISLTAATTGNTIGGTVALARNVISGNTNQGVYLSGVGTNSNTIAGNYIGLNAAGSAIVGNGNDGVYVVDGASSNTIGGATTAHRNVIAGNSDGVQFGGASGGANNNIVQNNYIGTDATGTVDLGNNDDGIDIDNGALNNQVLNNLIAGNTSDGIDLGDAGASTGTVIRGNLIGTAADGSSPLGNAGHGILIGNFSGTANNTRIGGTTAGQGNTIAFNGGDGIFMPQSTSVSMLGNAIYGNTGLAIDLGTDGVTANDAAPDSDGGANNLQNFPVLVTARTDGSTQLIVTGTLSSAANSWYRIEFFASTSQDGSGHGEGQRYLGSVDVPTNGSGAGTISTTLGATVAVGEFISATATRATDNTYSAFTDTSEFARNIAAVSSTQATVAVDTTSDANDGDTTSLSTLLANKGADGRISLREAIVAANNTANGSSADRIVFNIGLSDANHVYYRNNGVAGSFSAPVTTTLADAAIVDFDADYAAGSARSWYRISLSGNYLDVTQAVIIDGTTQAGWSVAGGPVIEINAANITAPAGDLNAIALTSGASTIRGLVINGAPDNAIEIDVNADNSVIVGNYFGTDVSGTVARANATVGVWGALAVKADGVVIGGTSAADRNLISGNTSYGIEFYSSASNAVVQGNYIGTTVTGSGSLGNGVSGIYIRNGAGSNTIGGTLANEGNLIASNGGDGIWVASDAGTGNRILGNTIRSNTGLGVDLGADGVTANDAGDADTGANNQQNFPVLSSARTNGAGQVVVTGTLNSSASSWYRIEFFASSAQDGSGYGEGQVYLGFINVATNSAGNAVFSGTLSATVASGSYISATATKSNNTYTTFTDTSEFAANVQASAMAFNTVPGAQATPEDTSRVFSSANGNAISIADADAGGANNEVTISVTNGSLTLAGTTGLTFVAGDGTSDATMTFRGTAAAINTALNGLAYAPTANYNGGAVLTLATRDTTLLALNIDAALQGRYEFSGNANDTSPGTVQNGTLNGNAAIVTDAVRGQVLSLDGSGDFVQITGTYGSPTEVTIGGWVNLTSVVGRGDFISLSDRVHISLDETGVGVKGSVQTGAAAWTDLGSGHFIAGTGWHHVMYTYSDTGNVHRLYIDGSLVASATIAGSIYWTSPGDSFIGKHPTSGSGLYVNGLIDEARIYSRALTAGEVATLANDLPLTDADTVAVTVTAVNDAPVVATTGSTLAYTENNPATAVDAGLTLGDGDSANLAGATVTISANYASGQDTLAFTDQNGISGIWNAGTGVLALSGSATVANYQTALRSITYVNGSDTPSTSTRTVSFVVNDGSANSNTGTRNVSVTAVNDAPVITSNAGGPTAALSIAENTTAVTTVTSTDADGGAAVYSIVVGGDGAKFTINPSTGALAFIAAPDYEAPTDTGGNNVYDVTVQVSDGSGGTDTQAIAVTVTDVANTLVVTTTADTNDTGLGSSFTVEQLNAGKGTDNAVSLREAIIAANTTSGLNSISFNIAGAGPHTINLLAALPAISGAVIIDGSSEPDFAGAPLIELNGAGAGAGVSGLYLDAGAANSVIRGLVINRFANTGIVISADNVTIAGNYIGISTDGTADLGNGGDGILLDTGADNAVIGGAAAADRNVISGNQLRGIAISGGGVASGHLIQGNYIGTNAAGSGALGNGGHGIDINQSAANTIRGNVISGNGNNGVILYGESSDGNILRGNRIGTDAAGNVAIGNGGDGIYIMSGADNNLIGGTTATDRNQLSGNASDGIEIVDAGTSGNIVSGNYIGTNAAGTGAVANARFGVVLYNGVSGNIIGGTAAGAGNVVSGNANRGIQIDGNNNAATTGNLVQGNIVGLNAAGTAALGNGGDGILVYAAINAAVIGGTAAGAGNVISGNTGRGIYLSGSSGTLVQGNIIGLASDGVTAIGNTGSGVLIQSGGNTIGGTAAGARNVISGNGLNGVQIEAPSATGNTVQGNYIGTDASGALDRGNAAQGVAIWTGASGNTIGGTSAAARNVISGNNDNGVIVADAGTSNNVIQGNAIGINAAGTATLGNGTQGVWIGNGATNNTLGGSVLGAGNVIGGNTYAGVELRFAGTSGNQVQGNFIGTDAGGSLNFGNGGAGVLIQQDASGNVIGGTADGAGNTIRFNTNSGIVVADAGSTGNALLRNSISGNGLVGIDIGSYDGVTANDSGDTDTGANNRQNFPVLTSAATIGGGQVRIDVDLDSLPSGNYRIELFASSAADASGYGEGQRYLGFANVSTDMSGKASVQFVCSGVAAGEVITATATDASNNTSEFSLARVVVAPAIVVTPTSGLITTEAGGTATFSVVLTTRPNNDVLINLATSDATEGSVSAASLTFTSANWNVAQTVTVTGLQDYVNDGSIAYSIVTAAAVSTDPTYSGLNASDVGLVNDEAANAAPVNGVPGAQTVTEDATLVFSTANGNAVTVGDADAGSTAVRVTLTATNGTLSLWGTTGLTFSSGDGTADAAMTFTGTLTDINAALNGLAFTPTGNFNGAASLSIATDDQGNSGTGGARTDSDTVAITVTAVNDAPVASGSASLAAVLEDAANPAGATVAALFGANFSDAADAGNPSQNQLAGVAVRGQNTAVIATQGRWQYSIDNGTTWNNFGVSDTTAKSLGLTDRLRFLPAANYNGPVANLSARLIDNSTTVTGGATINVSSNGFATPYSAAIVSIGSSVTSVNDAPAGSDRTVSTSEDAAYTFTAADFALSDASDAPANALLAVRITTLPGAGTLANNGSAVTAGQVVTLADINLGRLRYTPAADGNGAGHASFIFQVQDDGGTANGGVDLDASPNTMTIDVTAVNDAPLHSVPGAQSVNEDTALVFSTANGNRISIADVDAAAGSLRVTIGVGSGSLTLSGTAGLAFTVGDGSADATMTFTGTLAAINSALDGLAFNPAANFNGAVTLSIATDDQGNSGSGGALSDSDTVAITVSAVNDAPAITSNGSGPAAAVSVAEGQTAVTTVTSSDIDGGTAFYSIAGADASRFTIDTGTGVLVFNTAPNYELTTDANGDNVYELTVQVADGNGGFDTQDISVTVTNVNEAPVNAVPGAQTTAEDTALVFSVANGNAIAVNDTEAVFDPLRVTLSVSNGSLTLAGTAGLTFTVGDGSGDATMSFTGSRAAINNALNGLAFAPAANFNGTATLQLTTDDQGFSGSGGPQSDTDTVSINVSAVNDAPSGAPVVTGSAVEDQTLSADTSSIADADGLGSFSYQWQRNGVAVAGATASTYLLGDADVGASIRVVVSYTDGNGTAESLTSAAVGPVANVNDAPSGAPAVTGSAIEDQTLSADTSSIADADGLGAFSYQWQRNGVAIAGATGSAYTLGDADVGASIRVVVSYTDGRGAAESLTSVAVGPVVNANDAPSGAPVVTGIATEDQTLSVDTSTIADADGLGAFSYQWQRNGVAIGGATASTYTLGDTDVGTSIRVVVSYIDGRGTAESLTSAAVGPVANVNDAPSGAPVVTGSAIEDQTLSADTSSIADADGLGAFAYQWQRNGVNVAAANGSTYALGDADVGASIRVVVSYTDGRGTAESLTSAAVGPIANVNDAPSGAPVVTGTPTEDQTLSADTSSLADADGLGTFSYQWQRNGVNVAGATGSTYTLGDADVGTSMRVIVSYTDGRGAAESLTSVAVGPVANVNDAPSGVPVVTGTPTEDQTLSADTSSIADADGLGAFAYQWQRNGVAIAGATGSSYTLGDADVGTSIRVIVSYTDGRGTAESLTSAPVGPVANVNDAPSGAPVVSGTPTEDQTLSADTSSIADADGLGTFAYQWQRNGVAIAGATASTYTLGDADVGASIRVIVSYTDGRGTGETLTSAAVGPIVNVNDAPSGAPVVTGTPTEDQTLSADTSSIADADGLGTFAYQWQRNGVAIAGATASTYTLGDADVGTSIRVIVSYTDGHGTVESLTSAAVGPVANVNDTPSGAPVVSGTPTEDQTLSADTSSIADADGLGALSYQWQRNGVAIAGATGSTYTLGDADVGTSIRVVVSYTDGNGTPESLTSAAVGPIVNVNDAPSGAPVVTGTPTEDQTLSADTSSIADADGLGTFAYQWQRNGVAIAGATASTYTLGDADVGTSIRVIVSYTDGRGTVESLTSAAVGPVANVNDTPSGAPVVSGTPTEDQTLSADTSSIADADGLGAFSYQWQRNGANIAGATVSTYTLGDADVGTSIRVIVSYTDGRGTAETLTSVAVGPIANVNDAPSGAPVVTGTPTEDQTLSADTSSIADADGLSAFSYQWQRNGVAIAGATTSTYTLGDADVGASMRVVVSYTDGRGTLESLVSAAVGPVANVNDAPSGAPVVTGTATEDQTLSADTSSIADADGLGAFSYQWQRNGVAIAGATASTYALGDADVGTSIRVIVSYTDGNGTPESLISAAVGPVANVNDAPSGSPSITGTPTEDQTLSADTSSIADADGLGAFSYQWLRNGANIAGATASTYTLGDADVGTSIRVVVSYTDGNGSAESLTSAAAGPVANVNDTPSGAPVVTGTPTEDQTLSANTSSIADADGLGTFAYQWQRNGANIAGATASTYMLGDADVGASIRVVVSYTDGNGTPESPTSAAVGPVVNVNDAPSGAPVVTGTATEDQTLSADTSSIADADGLGPFSYQWQRNGANIAGATASTYTLGDADVGASIRVVVSYTDFNGTPESLASAAVGPIANVNDAPTITSNGGGAAATVNRSENQTVVTTVTSTDIDGAAPQYSVTGGADAARFAIDAQSGALSFVTAPNFEAPADADADNVYQLVVSVSDGQGGTASQAIAVAVANVNEAPGRIAPAAATVLDHAKAGTLVATVTASDPDAGDLFTFSLVNDGGGRFVVDAANGRLTVASGALLDFGSAQSHTLLLRVTDAGGLTTEQPIVVSLLYVKQTVSEIGLPTVAAPSPAAIDNSATPSAPLPGTQARESTAGRGDTPYTPPPLQRSVVSGAGAIDEEPSSRPSWLLQRGASGRDGAPVLVASVSFSFGALFDAGQEAFDAALLNLGQDDDARPGSSLLIARGSSIEAEPLDDAKRSDQNPVSRSVVAAVQDPVRVASATLTAGFVWWLTRSGGLLTSILMGIPAWRHVDLLPVLAPARDDDDDEDEDGSETSDDSLIENRHDTMVDQLFSNTSRLFGQSRLMP